MRCQEKGNVSLAEGPSPPVGLEPASNGVPIAFAGIAVVSCTSFIFMKTKLTLWLDDRLISAASDYARHSGKSLSQVVAEYFTAITSPERAESSVTPTVAKLRGILKDADLSGEADYLSYLEEKHLCGGGVQPSQA